MEVIKLSGKDYKKVLGKSVKEIKDGKILVCPTDTVYGLIGDATNEKAFKKISQIKNRSRGKPIPVFVKDIQMAKKLAEINAEQESFLKKVWPGAVTVVLKSKRGRGTVGIRIPRHRFVLNLMEKLNHPLAESSANISGRLPAKDIKGIINQFKSKKYQPDLILDGGGLKSSKPSKVIDLTGSEPKILRK